MAFVDVPIPYAAGQVSANVGASPTGGGAILSTGPTVISSAPGTDGVGGNGQIHHWVLAFYAIIAVILIGTGVLFNGKGRR